MAAHMFAAIDVGSFELELGIYEITTKNGIREVDHLRHVIALGKDTYNTGKISYELADETCMVLEDFVGVMKAYGVTEYRAYATSAMREAKNNQIVLDQIRVRTGIEVKIISNSEQRFISYKAIASKAAEFDKTIQKGTAIVDVGFGSMQISLFDKEALVSTQNLMLGVLRIRELFSTIPAEAAVHQKLIEELVDNELFTFRKMYLKERDIKNIIGIGESVLYLAKRSDGEKPATRISAEQFQQFYDRLIGLSIDQVEERFGVNEEYAALLLPSAIIFKRILEITGAEMFWVPGIRLCDGIVAEYADEKKLVKLSHNFEEDILVASRNMSKRYKCHTSHIQIIEKYVLDIFDTTKRFHGLGQRERLLLRIATILHDCGKFISMKNPSQCAYYIIMATEIIGLSHSERTIIANVVRYNVEEFGYNQIRSGETILIGKLTAMLRLANALDRSHNLKLSDCRMAVKGGQLVITTDNSEDITLEAMSFLQKADFFEEIMGIRPVLKQKRRV